MTANAFAYANYIITNNKVKEPASQHTNITNDMTEKIINNEPLIHVWQKLGNYRQLDKVSK